MSRVNDRKEASRSTISKAGPAQSSNATFNAAQTEGSDSVIDLNCSILDPRSGQRIELIISVPMEKIMTYVNSCGFQEEDPWGM